MAAWLEKVEMAAEVRPKDFLKFLEPAARRELLRSAKLLGGKRVVHVNATAEGGGVAEIMRSLIHYLRALGVQSDWYSIGPAAGRKFFGITDRMRNALQGAPVKISAAEWAEYRRVNERLARELDRIDCDLLAVNDPQPLLAGNLAKAGRKVYFSHMDTSAAFRPVWNKIAPLLGAYRRLVVSSREFVPGGLPRGKVKVFTPAIDPLARKQEIVSRAEARAYLQKHGGIPADCPLVAQVSRFDIWKNPLGVIQAFRIMQSTYPAARLALVGFNEARDNPEAAVVYRDVAALAGKSKDIFIFFNPRGRNVEEFTVMVQNAADVIVQNSIKEGFGLTVAEAMWKNQPVVGGPAAGIRKQVKNGVNGFIVRSPEELARKISFLLAHPQKKKLMGRAARKTVARDFLFPRLVLDHLKLYAACIRRGRPGGA